MQCEEDTHLRVGANKNQSGHRKKNMFNFVDVHPGNIHRIPYINAT